MNDARRTTDQIIDVEMVRESIVPLAGCELDCAVALGPDGKALSCQRPFLGGATYLMLS
jgi:hypothetical protein